MLKRHRRSDLVARADYAAATATEKCTSCGICVERCVFDARSLREGMLHYDQASCFGCGLCVTTCGAEAVTMETVRGGNS